MNNEQRRAFHDYYISEDLSKTEEIVKTFPPSIIKFFSDNDYNLNALREQKVWFSSPNNFNDPFDCVVNVDYEKIVYEEFKEKCYRFFTEEDAEKFLNLDEVKSTLSFLMPMKSNRYKNNIKNLIDSIFVSCFSEQINLTSLRMWGYYANSHKGFCLEYSLNDFYKASDFRELIPVFYSNEYSLYYKFKPGSEFRKCKLTLLFTKAYEWCYEKEWRLIMPDKEHAGEIGFLSPFIIPKRAFLGCKMDKRFREDLLSICKEKDITPYEVYMIPNSYKLECRKLDI